MTTQNLALFKGLTAKMGYLNHRQSVIAQNIANADTPNYNAQDLTKPSFDKVLKAVDKHDGTLRNVTLARTSQGHSVSKNDVSLDVDQQDSFYEVAPDGNAVIMEEQMIKSQETAMDYNLATNLYQKNVSMIMTSLGR